MSSLKCPFCKEEIISDLCLMFDKKDKDYTNGRQIYKCNKCGLFGTKELWQALTDSMEEHDLCHDALVERTKELDSTRRALDVAVDALKDIDKTRSVANHKIGTQDKTLNSGIIFCWTTPDEIHNALEQITALEQKDVK